MLDKIQNTYFDFAYLKDYPWIQALILVVGFILVAWIFDRFIISTLRRYTVSTRFEFDNRLVDMLHGPIYTSIIILGIALAVHRLGPAEPFDFIIYSSLESIAYLVWTVL